MENVVEQLMRIIDALPGEKVDNLLALGLFREVIQQRVHVGVNVDVIL
jgi:hypothetical protein